MYQEIKNPLKMSGSELTAFIESNANNHSEEWYALKLYFHDPLDRACFVYELSFPQTTLDVAIFLKTQIPLSIYFSEERLKNADFLKLIVPFLTFSTTERNLIKQLNKVLGK